MTNSIYFRLVALFTLVTTLTLSLFGVYAHSALSNDLNKRFAAIQESSLARLQATLPEPLWNYDKATTREILAAEGSIKEITRIQVFDQRTERVIIEISLNGTSRSPLNGHWAPVVREGPLVWTESEEGREELIGRVVVTFTPEHIEASLKAQLFSRVIEVLILDVLLVALLVFSLRMVFRPLHQLRDALFDLAGNSAEIASELPDSKFSEFSEVVRGFNLTLRKLRDLIDRHAAAKVEAQEALQQLKITQSELLRAEKLAALGSMVAGVAHELNTPIGNAMMAASTIDDSAKKFDQLRATGVTKSGLESFLVSIRQGAQLLFRNVQRAADLVSSFKRLSGVSDDRRRGTFELHEVVQSVIRELAPALKASPYVLINAVPDGVVITGYPDSLQEIMRALISNSLTHAFEGREHGTMRFRYEELDAEHIALIYRDDGIGMTPEVLNRIFEPFFTTKLGRGGSGLGLHIVHNLTTGLLGGGIDVSSSPGKGCEFQLRLPKDVPEPGPVGL